MKKYIFLSTLLAILFIASACTASAAPQAPTALPTATAIPAISTATLAPAKAVLEISGPGGTKALTLDEIKALPVTQGQAGIKSSTGKITLPATFKGVALKDLAGVIGSFDNSMGINLIAKDGYSISFSYDQVSQGVFIAYDPATGDELKTHDPLTAVLAYEMDGKPLNEETDGVLRLAILSEKNNQVTDGHWSVKWVTRLEIKTMEKEWTLNLAGAIQETMDRATFESGAAPSCHQKSWTDDKAQKWVGIPLWLLVGRVDDDIKHSGPAFNDALADAGYSVEVVALDGYSATFDIQRLKRNDNILVAYLVNDNPLPDKYFPLMLVGSDLQKNEKVGMIAKIVLHLNVQATPAPTLAATALATAAATAAVAATPAPGGEATLLISGLVEKPLSLKEADLRAMEVVKITAEHPKTGSAQYQGVRLNALLDRSTVKAEATKLVLIAGDGYTTEVNLATVKACADCLVAFTETPGKLYLVMPGQASGLWVKDVVKIEVK